MTISAGYDVITAMHDQRATQRVIGYWNKLRKELPIPPWERFNHGAIEDLWGRCCLWRLETPRSKRRLFKYEYMGAQAQEAFGMDPTGEYYVRPLKIFPGACIMERLDEAVDKLGPLLDEGQFVGEHNKVVKYRSCLLPFGTRQGKVTHVLLAMSWRAF